jgi:alanine racemase
MNERALARVDLAAVERNCTRLRGSLTGGAELCAVVKADGYGHGGVRCAGAALAGGATRLAVATAREAAELRDAHPGASVLTMGALTPGEVDVALAADSDVSAWRAESLALLAGRARAAGRRARVHVKYDSGMGRLGNRDAGEVLELAAAAEADPDLELAGVWTHMATADEPDSGFLATQLRAFSEVAAAARVRHPGVLLHAANSAATLADPGSHFDMVRCGIAVYGLDPFGADPGEQGLEPALSLHSYVADVKRFEPGDSAGYGRTWRASEPTWVGVLPIGYGDGVRRGLSNNAEVLVAGRRRPLVGTVSMDNITVDLGSETDVSAGEPAVLIGAQGEERISAEELAANLGTINYEVTCGISARVPREFR